MLLDPICDEIKTNLLIDEERPPMATGFETFALTCTHYVRLARQRKNACDLNADEPRANAGSVNVKIAGVFN